MTGRGAGHCAGIFAPGYANLPAGRSFWGWCNGRRHWAYAAGLAGRAPAVLGWLATAAWLAGRFRPFFVGGTTRQREIDALKSQAEYVSDALDGLRRRIEQLEPEPGKV
jgi:hypothetical protein